MIKTLVAIRFRALLAGLTAQGRQKKKRSTGAVILFAILYLYLFAVIAGAMCLTFASLAEVYHGLDLDWLYFAVAGLMGLGFAVVGSVFTTQSQLYDAKDNELLLAMPIPPRAILLSRMLPLLALNLLFAGIVMVPAMVMYAILVEFSPMGLLLQLAGLLGVCILAQSIACLLGWLLHLLLRRMNKSLASLLYLVVFLGVYFTVYSQAGTILQNMALGAEQIADTLQLWVWPLYALGMGSIGSFLHFLAFTVICAVLFGLVYRVLSATFLHAATAKGGRKRRKLDLNRGKVRTPVQAVTAKELRKFLGCPVYLTNMGMGVILTLALPIASVIFRGSLLPILEMMGLGSGHTGLLVCVTLAFTLSTAAISTPSVSLEGKNLWILKSLPISSRDILLGKLRLHLLLTVPTAVPGALILSAVLGCGLLDCLLCALICGLLAVFTGLIGMWAGLQWAKLDYISEAYPCKQSISVLVAMLLPWGFVAALAIVYLLVSSLLSPTLFMGLCVLLLAAVCYALYRVLLTWGIQKWEALQS